MLEQHSPDNEKQFQGQFDNRKLLLQYLMLADLTKHEISQLLRLMAELEDAAILANECEVLWGDVNDKLSLVD